MKLKSNLKFLASLDHTVCGHWAVIQNYASIPSELVVALYGWRAVIGNYCCLVIDVCGEWQVYSRRHGGNEGIVWNLGKEGGLSSHQLPCNFFQGHLNHMKGTIIIWRPL